jgi:hypothetical protein
MEGAIRTFVRERAQHRCAYCRVHEDDDPFYSFHLEHIIARQHGGGDEVVSPTATCTRERT